MSKFLTSEYLTVKNLVFGAFRYSDIWISDVHCSCLCATFIVVSIWALIQRKLLHKVLFFNRGGFHSAGPNHINTAPGKIDFFVLIPHIFTANMRPSRGKFALFRGCARGSCPIWYGPVSECPKSGHFLFPKSSDFGQFSTSKIQTSLTEC